MKSHGSIKAVACRPTQVLQGAIAHISLVPKGSPPQSEFYTNGFFHVVEGEAPGEYFYEHEDGPVWADDPSVLLHKVNARRRLQH